MSGGHVQYDVLHVYRRAEGREQVDVRSAFMVSRVIRFAFMVNCFVCSTEWQRRGEGHVCAPVPRLSSLETTIKYS